MSNLNNKELWFSKGTAHSFRWASKMPWHSDLFSCLFGIVLIQGVYIEESGSSLMDSNMSSVLALVVQVVRRDSRDLVWNHQ